MSQDISGFFKSLALDSEIVVHEDTQEDGTSFIFSRQDSSQAITLALGEFPGPTEELETLKAMVGILNSALALANRQLVLVRTLDVHHVVVGKERWASFDEHVQFIEHYEGPDDEFREVEYYVLEFQRVNPS